MPSIPTTTAQQLRVDPSTFADDDFPRFNAALRKFEGLPVTDFSVTTLACAALADLWSIIGATVAIAGGTVTGITDLAVADGGTGASTAAAARSGLSASGRSSSLPPGEHKRVFSAVTYGEDVANYILGLRAELESLKALVIASGVDLLATLTAFVDAFTTAHGAGSVDGTASDGSADTRNVVDTVNALSVAAGKLTFSKAADAGNPASWENPGLWYDRAITRRAGFVACADLTPAATNQEQRFGFAASNPGILGTPYALWLDSAADLRCMISGSGNKTAATYAAATYRVAIVLRSTGAFFFVRGGAFAKWTLVYVCRIGTTATMYLGATAYISATVATGLTADNLKSSSTLTLWLPQPLVSDAFGGLAGVLNGRLSDGEGHAEANGGAGMAWTDDGLWTLNGAGAVLNTPTPGAEALVNGNFAAWTGGDPDNWTLNAVEDGTNYVSENPAGQAQIVSDNGKAMGVKQAVAVVDTWHRVSVDVKALTTGTLDILNNATAIRRLGATGVRSASFLASHADVILVRTAACDVTIDDASLKPLTLSELFSSVNPATRDVIVSAKVTLDATDPTHPAGVAISLDSAAAPANLVLASIVSDGAGNYTLTLRKCVAGSWSTVIVPSAITYVAGSAVEVHRRDNSYRAFYNGTPVGAASTIADADIASARLAGVFSTYQGNTLDDFEVWPGGASGEHEDGLNQFA